MGDTRPQPDLPVLVGPAGWSYPDWEGAVYPRPHPRGFHPLAYLARYVDLVELNATFYAVPAARSAARWTTLVADRPAFRFVAKVHRGFTHEPGPFPAPAAAQAFLDGLAPLVQARRLEALLAQFPLSFRAGPAECERLARLAEAFGSVPLVLELRHRTWFLEPWVERVAALGVSVAWLDLPAARDHPPASAPRIGPLGYVRLHGRNASAWFERAAGRDRRYDWLYAPQDLEAIATRVRAAAEGGRRTFVVTNNHYGGKAVANALELRTLLEGRPVPAPETLRGAFPHLTTVTRPEGQGSLF